MTLAEFKAWFEGFTEDMDGAPNEKQFKKIKAKVKEITGTPITPTVIREYYHRYQPWWGYGSYPIGAMTAGGLVSQQNPNDSAYALSMAGQNAMSAGDVSSALYDCGKAEYKAMLS